MTNQKVSIVMPCYNGADTIARAIRGVTQQTYRPIQFILVNDGSTDDSDKVIRMLEPEILEAGIEFVYHLQNNLGLGGAINTGLKFVNGAYLAWIDADDELLPDSVRIRVEFLEAHPEFGSVTSDAFYAEDTDWEHPLGRLTHNPEENNRPNQFLPMLLGQSVFCAGCHMVRTEVFRTANGGMDINPFRYGQNLQLLLPVYYVSKHAFLNQPLYKYRVNAQNMSAEIRQMSLTAYYRRRKGYIENARNILKRIQGMPDRERRQYERMFRKLIFEGNLDAAIQHQSKPDILFWKIAVKLTALFV
jgi:glycosyltransferase involved in cell wall biosynthesis